MSHHARFTFTLLQMCTCTHLQVFDASSICLGADLHRTHIVSGVLYACHVCLQLNMFQARLWRGLWRGFVLLLLFIRLLLHPKRGVYAVLEEMGSAYVKYWCQKM